MADAKITLTLSPHEFDLMREVLRAESDRLKARAQESTGSIAATQLRMDLRAQAASIDLFLERL